MSSDFANGATNEDGVIKFQLEFENTDPVQLDVLDLVEKCRQRMREWGLIGGNDPNRYEGYGFGNISHRLPDNKRQFIISGTQTGHLESMGAESYAVVTDCFLNENRLKAKGPVKPSSEAMTHAVIYQTLPDVQCVIHVHSPDIWLHANELCLPQTRAQVQYGTPEMAHEMESLIQHEAMGSWRTISMRGHEDGVIMWGKTLEEAEMEVETVLNDAKWLQKRKRHSCVENSCKRLKMTLLRQDSVTETP